MKCPKCQFEIPEGLTFCGKCGAKLKKVCPKCNFVNPFDYSYCGECGHDLTLPSKPISRELSFDETVLAEERRIQFKGTGFQALGWGLLYIVLTLFIIPAAWGAVYLYRWFVRNLSFSDGTKASFEGRGGEVWGYFVFGVLLGLIPQLSRAVKDPGIAFFVSIGLTILLWPISAAVWLKITRWFFSSIRLSCGTKLSFKGNYGSYLGWGLLFGLSMFTIVGWAWVSVAILRWMCRNIEAEHKQLFFVGNGWGLLWRSFLAVLASILIIPIPWVVVWIVRWYARNMLIKIEQKE